MQSETPLEKLNRDVVACVRCPRLRRHCLEVAKSKRKAYLDWNYWGLPIPGFGDPRPKLMIVGLAPAAHGANRTGRIFTGDRSGDWLYRALHRSGFANQPTATHRGDGLKLREAYVTCSVRCAPPDNKPLPEEFANCSEYLQRELDLFYGGIRAFVALGALGLGQLERELRRRGVYSGRKMKFGHGHEIDLADGKTIIASYHPSQQNTFTGKLTDPMFQSIFDRCRELVGG